MIMLTDAKQPVDQTALCESIVGAIDLTNLGADVTVDNVVDLCRSAKTRYGSVAAVCVWPRFVHLAATELRNSPVRVAAVANFPDGDNDIDRAVKDARYIVESGGDEVDVVFPWRFLAAGDTTGGLELVAATRAAIGPEITLKVILETGELAQHDLIVAAAKEAIAGGADILKTSTGKTPTGATTEAVGTLLEVLEAHRTWLRARGAPPQTVGLKISGGIRTVDQLMPYLDLVDERMGSGWRTPETFRIGASSLLRDLLTGCVLAEPDTTP